MINADLLVSLVSLALAGVVFFVTRDLSPLGATFVNYTLVAMVSLSLLMLIKAFARPERIKFFESAVERHNIAWGLGILMAYLILMPLAGFLPASYLFYAVFNLYLGEDRLSRRNIAWSLGLSFVVVSGFYLVFHNLLGVPLSPGSLWQD